jgi:hypothetical protein
MLGKTAEITYEVAIIEGDTTYKKQIPRIRVGNEWEQILAPRRNEAEQIPRLVSDEAGNGSLVAQ